MNGKVFLWVFVFLGSLYLMNPVLATTFLYVVLGLLIAMYLLTPFALIRYVRPSKARAEITSIELETESLMDRERSFLRETDSVLTEEGFRRCGDFHHLRVEGAGESVLGVYFNPQTCVVASPTIVLIRTKEANARRITQIRFLTEFNDDDGLLTWNGPELTAAVSDRTAFNLPSIKEPRRLYRCHLRLLNLFDSPPGRPIPASVYHDPAEYLHGRIAKQNAARVAKGYARLSADGLWIVPTWKAFLILNFRIAWPFGALFRTAAAWRERRLLARIEERCNRKAAVSEAPSMIARR